MKIEITKEMLEQAVDYMPTEVKDAWVSENALKVFDKLSITADEEPMPPMYAVNAGLKARYLMSVFVSFYMKQPLEADTKDEALMSVEQYDVWAGSHALNQLERMKREKDLRDKCFDLLSDYKDLEKRFSTQILSLLTVQNDMLIRQSQYTATQMKELPALLEQLKELQGKVEDNGE